MTGAGICQVLQYSLKWLNLNGCASPTSHHCRMLWNRGNEKRLLSRNLGFVLLHLAHQHPYTSTPHQHPHTNTPTPSLPHHHPHTSTPTPAPHTSPALALVHQPPTPFPQHPHTSPPAYLYHPVSRQQSLLVWGISLLLGNTCFYKIFVHQVIAMATDHL